MSWHFSRALEAEYLEANSLGGEPCVRLNSTPTPVKSLEPGKTTGRSKRFPFGTTFAPLTGQDGEGLLTWCLEVSRVRTSVRLEPEPGLTENAPACGESLRGSFARWDRGTSLWRTPQCSLLEGLDVYSQTWPRWGMMRGGVCSVQMMLEPLISGNGSGSGGDAVKQWPTPAARDHRHPNAKPYSERGGGPKGEQLPNAVGGSLNPTWVEWLMGWPVGWTDCAVSATGRFQEWLRLHGRF